MFSYVPRIIENYRFTENIKVKHKNRNIVWESKVSIYPDSNKLIYEAFHSLAPVMTSVTFSIQLKLS